MKPAFRVPSLRVVLITLGLTLALIGLTSCLQEVDRRPSETSNRMPQKAPAEVDEPVIGPFDNEPNLNQPENSVATSSSSDTEAESGREDLTLETEPLSRSALEQQLADLPPSNRMAFRTHYRQGLEMARLYQIERALAEFDRSLEILPDHPEPLFQKARMLIGLGEFIPGIMLLDRVVKIDPQMLAPRCLLRDLYAADGPRPDQEKGALQNEAIRRICGELGEFDYTLGRWLYQGGGTNPQLDLLRRRIELGRELPLGRLAYAYALRGGALILESPGLDHNLRADREFKALSDQYPGLVGILLEQGQWLMRSQIRFDLVEDPNEPPMDSTITLDIAQTYFERAFDVSLLGSRLSFLSLLNLGHVARDMGVFDEALQIYQLVLNQPDVPEDFQRVAHFHAGVVHCRMDDLGKARVSFEKAREIEDDPVIRWFLYLTGAEQLPFRPEAVTAEHRRTLKFVDVAPELGVDKYDGAGPSAWCDIESDGDLDLFVCGCDTFCILYRNDGNRFVDFSSEAGLEHIASGFSSTFADYDNDGDCDLYVGRNGWSGPSKNSLYRNRGDGTFEDVTDQAGVGHPGSTFVHGWSDFDRDGFLDLYLANGITKDGSTNCLYRNNGDGTFSDFTKGAGLAERPGTQTIGFGIGDYNRDGWPDIFVNSWRDRNRLYSNQGNGRFADVATFAGVDGRRHPASGYLGFIEDFDNDTWPDILLTKLCPSFGMTIEGMLIDYKPDQTTSQYTSKLYRNKGDGWTFEDVSDGAGLIYAHGSMGGSVADLNNDGWLDFYLGTGDPWLPRMEQNALYVNTGKGSFVDLTRFTGLGHLGKGHGITLADFDFDGDLDIYAPQGGFVHGDLWHNALYRNELGNRNNWLQVLLEGTRSNRMGVGAQLNLKSGDLTIYSEMKAGGQFGSSSSPFVHFGLGGRDRIEVLEVSWPSGERTAYRNVPVNRFIKIVEGSPEVTALELPER